MPTSILKYGFYRLLDSETNICHTSYHGKYTMFKLLNTLRITEDRLSLSTDIIEGKLCLKLTAYALQTFTNSTKKFLQNMYK